MNDWAVILGASSGIGAECAQTLAKKGINIYGIYLRKKNSEIEKLTNNLKKYNVQIIYKKANHIDGIGIKIKLCRIKFFNYLWNNFYYFCFNYVAV